MAIIKEGPVYWVYELKSKTTRTAVHVGQTSDLPRRKSQHFCAPTDDNLYRGLFYSQKDDLVMVPVMCGLTYEESLDLEERMQVYHGLKTDKEKRRENYAAMGKSRAGKPSPMKGKPQTQITCPHCGKTGGNTMPRWHFDNCKNKQGPTY